MSVVRRLLRSKTDRRLDDLHDESRAENARASAEGKGRELLAARAKLLGLSSDPKKRPKMKFGER